MPISQGSTDRAEYALKHKRGAYEKEFTKLFALHALRIGSRTLPGNLSMLQEWANSIALDLGKVINMDRGGSLARTTLSREEKAGANKIGALLRKRRIRLAAVDWISGKITDFNITSPGLIVAMEKLLQRDLAAGIVRRLMG
jgi:hypothetical protein